MHHYRLLTQQCSLPGGKSGKQPPIVPWLAVQDPVPRSEKAAMRLHLSISPASYLMQQQAYPQMPVMVTAMTANPAAVLMGSDHVSRFQVRLHVKTLAAEVTILRYIVHQIVAAMAKTKAQAATAVGKKTAKAGATPQKAKKPPPKKVGSVHSCSHQWPLPSNGLQIWPLSLHDAVQAESSSSEDSSSESDVEQPAMNGRAAPPVKVNPTPFAYLLYLLAAIAGRSPLLYAFTQAVDLRLSGCMDRRNPQLPSKAILR